jgi:heat shock protein HslJ
MQAALIAALALALAACSQAPQNGGSDALAPDSATPAVSGTTSSALPLPASTTVTPAADATSMLTQYHWQLTGAVNAAGQRIGALFARPGKPLQLDFVDQSVSIQNTCNRMHASYSVAADKLTIGNLASTLMACNDPSLRALDAAAGKYLQGTFALKLDSRGKQPQLELTSAGNRLTFAGAPMSETR